MRKYTEEFKEKIRSDYQKGKFGYRRLSQKYGLTRGAIRHIIIDDEIKHRRDLLLNMKNENNQIEYLRTEAAFWKAYAEELEIKLKEDKEKAKKKQKSIQSKNLKLRKESLK